MSYNEDLHTYYKKYYPSTYQAKSLTSSSSIEMAMFFFYVEVS